MKILPVRMETAKESKNPFFIELYRIYLKTGIIRICNCDVVITFAGENYYPVPIERGSIKTTVDAKIDNMDLKIADADNEKISALMEGFDFRGRKVEIVRIQYPESLEDKSLVMPVFWGYLDAPSYSNGEFSVTVKASFPKGNVPFRTTQYICCNTFGDFNCQMDKARKEFEIELNSSTPLKIKLKGNVENDFYKNGLITIGYETKLIKTCYTEGVNYFYVEPYYSFNVDLTDKAVLTRNCDKTPEMCAKYNNRKHYGGFIAIPKEFRVGT